tara:strand:- start:117 stop:488 length:372 start_codon:yes stop_codon:yes gene_type:complete
MKVFKFTKGMLVPLWVQYLKNHEKFKAKFDCKGKLFVLDDGDLVIVASKIRKNESVIHIETIDGLDYDLYLKGAGDNDNCCHIYIKQMPYAVSAFKTARSFNPTIRNKAKCEPVPINDPRINK